MTRVAAPAECLVLGVSMMSTQTLSVSSGATLDIFVQLRAQDEAAIKAQARSTTRGRRVMTATATEASFLLVLNHARTLSDKRAHLGDGVVYSCRN